MNWLNKITMEDYLHAEGAQMAIRLLCEIFEHENFTFDRKVGDEYKTVKCKPYQILDAIRRFTAGIFNADCFLKNESIVMCPVWCDKKGKQLIERIDIITKKEYDYRRIHREMADRP